jgi:MFS family permease
MDAAGSPPRWRDVLRGPQGRLIVGLLVLEILFALHFLTVATVMPAVLADLGDISLYGASFWAASLTQLAVIPIASAAVDRYGARRPLIIVAAIYTAGLLVSAAAPAMGWVVLGRMLQGIAAGSGYALSIGVVAKQMPRAHRARIMALMATTWILPGLLGPPLGALLVSTVGWRWAFIAPLPVLAVCLAMILPPLRDVGAGADTTMPVRRAAELAIGGFTLFASLTYPSPITIPIGLVGAVVAWRGLRALVPPGTFRAAPGPPAAAAAAFLSSVTFSAADSFVSLMLTEVRGLSIAAVGVGFTLQTVAWTAGSWWQSRQVERRTLGSLVVLGTIIMAVGFGIAATGLSTSVPIEIPYVGWVAAALGMGIVFPTIPLSAMGAAEAGREASDLSPTLLMDMSGVAVGQGLGGVALTNAVALGLGIAVGLGGAFLTTGVAAIVLIWIAPRIPDLVRSAAGRTQGGGTAGTAPGPGAAGS